ncbi:MAG: hypothetical protein KJO48_02400, partial [Ignavibacteria bacterium]|nr:hypothetical protein [Ignavibacteria bacterium]
MCFVILLTIFLSNILLFAQEESQNEEEFTIGAFFGRECNEKLFKSFEKSDMNTIICRADDETRKYISKYNVIANNADSKEDWIQFYATGFYTKWEAEENQKMKDAVGIKHKCGKQAIWKDKVCWSTEGYVAPTCSLMYGPHYKQERNYKRSLYGCKNCIDYTVSYRMALDYDLNVNNNDIVCRIKVVHRYAK